MLFNEVLKQARADSLYPHPKDFATAAGVSEGGYFKWESGERIPSRAALDRVLELRLFTETWKGKLETAWSAAKAAQAGIPAPTKSVDVSKMLNQMERELIVVLRKYASDSAMEHKRIVRTFKTRAGIILRTALET